MAVKLRLRREGTTKKPHYRVVVADSRSPRDGRFIEIIGHYHPMQEPSGIDIDGERALYWLKNGAQPSSQVEKLLRITGVWEEFKPGDEPKRVRDEKTKMSKKAKERAAEEAKEAEKAAEAGKAAEAEKAEKAEKAAEAEEAAEKAAQDADAQAAEATADEAADADAGESGDAEATETTEESSE